MEALIIIAVVGIALFFGIRWAIGYVRQVTYETGHGFLSIPFWLLVGSFFLAIYVGFTATEEHWVAVVVFGAIAIAGILNIQKVGLQRGIVFTILQCITIYCSVIVLVLYAVFKNAKELGPKID